MQQRALKVLLVEDDINIREVMSLILSLEGFEVTSLPDGHDVFVRVDKDRPDVVLLDARLGDLDGLVICEALKSDPATRPIPVMIVSASHDQAQERIRPCGANDILPKPFNIQELVARVKRLAA